MAARLKSSLVCRMLLLCAPLLLAGCGEPGYPEDWPAPASNLFARKGGCPDLSGRYDHIGSELPWLLGRNPDVETAQPAWFDHRARVDMADDGGSVIMQLGLSERGLPAWRDHLLRYNLDHPYEKRASQPLELKRDRDYACRGGWLYSLHYPQAQAAHGWQRRTLQVAKDASGALIAGATIRKDQGFGWGDAPGVSLWAANDTRWYRWPKRERAADDRLKALQSVELRRYRWINGGTRVPTRFTSFHLDPICMRVRRDGRWLPVPAPRLAPHEKLPSDPPCPDGWRVMRLGDTVRQEFSLPAETGATVPDRIEWRPAADRAGLAQVIPIPDPRQLPLMPGED